MSRDNHHESRTTGARAGYKGMRFLLVQLLVLTLALLPACDQSDRTSKQDTSQSVAQLQSNTDITVQQLHQILQERDVYLIDVRTPQELNEAHLAGTDDLIGYNLLGSRLESLPQDKSTEIIAYCRTGRRSGIAADFLRQAGYKNVRNVKGGITAWQQAGYPVERGEY